jgi:type II secretory pathway component PulJ
MAPSDAALVVSKLRAAETQVFLAKDLLRASSLPLLKEDNKHVAHDLEKVKKGTALSPVLLVAGDVTTNRPLVVADGYHRICASYWLDENAAIPCRIARL